MHHFSGGEPDIIAQAGNESFQISSWPIETVSSHSYDAVDAPLPVEEDDEGNIVPIAALDDQIDEFDEDETTVSKDNEGVE